LRAADLSEFHFTGKKRSHRGRSAADKNRLDFQSLGFEKTACQSDTKRKLAIPRKTRKYDAKILFFLRIPY
jgi:hypothetical protein